MILRINMRLSMLLLMIICSGKIYSQNWTRLGGLQANDIAVGKGGVVWATAKNGSIWRWTGLEWKEVGGGAVRLAVDPEGAAWVVNAGKQIYKYNVSSKQWELKSGLATDIGAGADGSIWIIGANPVPGGFDIYKWNGSGWTKVEGGALRVAVDPTGKAWVVNNSNTIFRYTGSGWQTLPGAVKDVAIGAEGSVWCTAKDGRIHKWENNNWALKSGGAENITVTPEGNPWVVNGAGEVYHLGFAITVKVRTVFPREQTWEDQVLKALRFGQNNNYISLGGNAPKTYSDLSPLQQGFGRLALTPVELFYAGNMVITPEQMLSQIGSYNSRTAAHSVSGILGVLIISQIIRATPGDVPAMAVKDWATDLYRSARVRSAKAMVDEYAKWKADYCVYERIPESQCRVMNRSYSSLLMDRKPPQDLIAMNSIQSVVGSSADEVAAAVATGVTAAAIGASYIGLTSGMTFTVSLFKAFGTAGIGILGSSFAGVVAAPVAAAVLVIVVGTIEGIAVVEAAKFEPMLKMKLGAAMTEHINIRNALSDSNSRNMFFLAFQDAAVKNFNIPNPQVNGEVRFYCQAGYVSNFRLTYNVNGQPQVHNTPDLPVGHEKTFSIPWNATNINVRGWYLSGTWKELFNQNIERPTYICYTSYGTIFDARYKTDCPEVGSMVTKANELTFTQGGGYVAWVKLTYVQDGQTVTVHDQSGIGAGWRKVFAIPPGVTNIRLQAWTHTGLVWEPYKSIVDKTWPFPPNECIKVYNTTLDPKWNSECN